MSSENQQQENTKQVVLDDLHRALGAKMVPFAGYDMPVNYKLGVLKEHLHCRAAAGLFDVSHMGQCRLIGEGADEALEKLTTGSLKELGVNRQRYTLFTNEQGGIMDDLMVSRIEDEHGQYLFLVVNAACKEQDFAHLKANLEPAGIDVDILEGHSLLALQGPEAASVVERLTGQDLSDMPFMSQRHLTLGGVEVLASRSGYTGEDGFEMSMRSEVAEGLARLLLEQPEVEPIGLGARGSLRLEAGLCLYGSDLDTTTTPVEGNLNWAIGKRRKEQGGFPGAEIIQRQLSNGVSRKRVGIQPTGRAPARAHTEIQDANGNVIGEITSGGFGPTAEAPVAMGYVSTENAEPGTPVNLIVRGKSLPAEVVSLPFVPQRYYRGK